MLLAAAPVDGAAAAVALTFGGSGSDQAPAASIGAGALSVGAGKPAADGTRKRSSRFRGVTKHRRSGRYGACWCMGVHVHLDVEPDARTAEAHVWVRESGKQVYLGGYTHEEHAAEAFDVACLKAKGLKAKINFAVSKYKDLLPYLVRMMFQWKQVWRCSDAPRPQASVTMEELVMAVRRCVAVAILGRAARAALLTRAAPLTRCTRSQSQGFARGSSAYRGVTHHPNGRWEARLGVPGSRHIYLGLFTEEEEAARACVPCGTQPMLCLVLMAGVRAVTIARSCGCAVPPPPPTSASATTLRS